MNLDTLLEETLAKAEKGQPDIKAFFSLLSTEQPEIFMFLFDEDTRLLTEQEHDYLLFLSMIILEVIQQSGIDLGSIDLETLEDMTEYNWGLIEHTSIENILDSVSQHPGSVLYDFIEEACTPEKGHDVLTEAAVPLVYVKCKSLVDVSFLSA
jgi:hypothetical protein